MNGIFHPALWFLKVLAVVITTTARGFAYLLKRQANFLE
jgi:hypothetical protein